MNNMSRRNFWSCPICGANMTSFKQIGKSIIYVCEDCDLGVTFPVPKPREPKQLGYSEKSYIENTNQYKSNFLSMIKKICKYKHNGKALDIGCGFGLFAYLLSKKTNFIVSALEPYLNSYFLKDSSVEIISKTLTEYFEVNKKREKFDLLTMIDVLEHMRNISVLEELRSLCKHKAIVFIQVPNYKSLMAVLCKYWSWWMVEDHVYHFSPKSLKKLFIKYGFTPLDTYTYENLWDFKKNLDGNFINIRNPILRKLIKGVCYLSFFPVYIIIRPLIWRLGYGGLIQMTIRF